MPVRKAVEISVDVPSRRVRLGGGLDNPADDDDKEAAAPPQKSAGKAPKSSGRSKRDRFSPYKATSSSRRKESNPGPGPATLLSEMDLSGPISSRTRSRQRGFPAPLPSVKPPRSARQSDGAPGPSSSRSRSAPAPQQSGPIERQKAKEDEWRSRLAKQASWWDSAAVAIKQTATMADIHMGEASRAYRKSDSSLRNLMRGRNHAAADMKGVEKWKDQAIDEFVGRDPAVREAEPPPPHIVPSPNHFDRLYGVPRKPLPSLRLEARTRLNADSQASQAREVATLEARSKAFGKRRMGS